MTREKVLSFDDIGLTSLGLGDFAQKERPGTSVGAVGQSALLAAAAVFGVLVGTGGVATAATLARVPASSSPSYHWERVGDNDQNEPLARLTDTRERVAQIRHYLSLNMTEMAKVLRVERPTVYAWLNGQATPQAANLSRLDAVFRMAISWRLQSSTPLGKYARERFEDGSVIDYLSEEQLNELAVRRLFSQVKPMLDQDKSRRASRHQSVAEAARRHGFPDIPKNAQQRAFDEETGL